MDSIDTSSILAIIFDSINAASGWFHELFTGEWYYLILGVVLFVIASRLLLAPLFAGRVAFGGSDSVKRSEKSGTQKKSSGNEGHNK